MYSTQAKTAIFYKNYLTLVYIIWIDNDIRGWEFDYSKVENSVIRSTPLEMDELEALLVEFGILDDDTKHADIIGKKAEEVPAT